MYVEITFEFQNDKLFMLLCHLSTSYPYTHNSLYQNTYTYLHVKGLFCDVVTNKIMNMIFQAGNSHRLVRFTGVVKFPQIHPRVLWLAVDPPYDVMFGNLQSAYIHLVLFTFSHIKLHIFLISTQQIIIFEETHQIS